LITAASVFATLPVFLNVYHVRRAPPLFSPPPRVRLLRAAHRLRFFKEPPSSRTPFFA